MDVSDSPELLLQLGLGEDQGRRPAVRAVVGVGDQVAAVEQGVDLVGRQRWPALTAALQATMCEHVGDQAVAGRRQRLGARSARPGRGPGGRARCRESITGVLRTSDRVAAERLDLEPELGQQLALFETASPPRRRPGRPARGRAALAIRPARRPLVLRSSS